MPHVDVPGARLYYETDGHASAPALLLLHASIANLRMWDPLISTLAVDHYVVRYDARGFGQSATENLPYRDREDARHVLDHLGVEQAVVVGASRGGRIGIDLAVETPERVAGLVTIGAGPSGFPDLELTDEEDAFVDRLDAAFQAQDWPALNRLDVELWCLGVNRQADVLDPDFVRTAYELNRPNLAHCTEAPIAEPLEPPAYDRVVDIQVPALVTVGEFDLSEALTKQAYLLNTIPDAAGYIFSDTAHIPSVENPSEFLEVLTAWLERNGL
ncbi:alpha/beta fold hydrolase [Rathayibacter soli]|uniref:alpha/beta fold hydrolase n=1 Tax=Rathayibacter soli TaxID=3144168 RepID=UPI0027E58BDF|nr:alpha/beta fold hydrolase [Glaciibacter superstes]